MPTDRLRVFVSSKMQELAAERAVIKEVLDELEVDAWVFEQDAGARPETIEETFKEQLAASDLYIGVFWKGYGDYTIEEFELARASRTDCLIYQKQGAEAAGRDPRLQSFLDRLGSVEGGITAQFFDTPEELREMVKRDTARWQARIVRRYREGGGRRGAGLPADPNLVVLRNKVKHVWVEGVLGRAAAETGLVELAMERRPDAVEHPAEHPVESADEGSGVIAPATTVREIFARLRSSLLILGDPGSGKTTTALQLVRDLVVEAERDESRPVPVVLNLSAWSPEWGTLAAWIARELSRKYQVPAPVSRPWLEQDRLVLVLDGLDEVAPGQQQDCAAAINRFRETYAAAGLVVTSRLEAYEGLPARLRLNGAIRLRALDSARIDAFLENGGEQLAALRAAMQGDETLQELARSPLMLSVMSLAYRGRTAEEFAADESDSPRARRARLLDAYVDRAFAERKGGWLYSREATSSWLSWLARRMAERSRTVFLIEDLQPSWLATRPQLGAYLAGFASLFGLVFGGLCNLYRRNPSTLGIHELGTGLPGSIETFAWVAACAAFALGVGWTDGLRFEARPAAAPRAADAVRRVAANLVVFGLLWVPIVLAMRYLLLRRGVDWVGDTPKLSLRILVPAAALTMGAAALGARHGITRHIRTAESLGLRWSSVLRGALLGALGGAPFAILTAWVIHSRDAATPPVWAPPIWAGLFWCVMGGAFGALLAGFQPRLVRGKTVPNQGMRLTARTALRAAGLAVPLAAIVPLAAWAVGGPFRQSRLILVWSIVALAFLAVCFVSWFGGLDLGKHSILRAVIGATRQGPWDFRRLLAEASRRNLTQRVGGGFMFVHRPLLEHFAAMDLPPPLPEEVRDAERGTRGSPARAIVYMSACALIGAAALVGGLAADAGWAVAAGAVLLGIGAQWLVIRSAVGSALADRRKEEDG